MYSRRARNENSESSYYRRREDQCLAVRIWNKCTPYQHIGGFIIIVLTVIFNGGGYWTKAQASMDDVVILKAWKEKVDPDLSAMRQEIHDIHEAVIHK